MTPADIIAQCAVLGLMLLGLRYRHLLDDCTDGNVERLERDDRAKEARWWLKQMDDAP